MLNDFDYVFKTKNESFNLSNVNLFERQVESDSARLQKGEITLTDLAQSESSLAGANANLIKAKTELQASQTNFERVIRKKAPKSIENYERIEIDLPKELLRTKSALLFEKGTILLLKTKVNKVITNAKNNNE